ncbi:hypothetical protein ACQ4PT_002494 [Festuca glaucescens]
MASNSNTGSGAGGGEQSAVQMLNVVRVIPPNDDPKWPLWRYVQKVAKTGGGQGGNEKIICRLCNRDISGSYSRVKSHLLKLGGCGVKPCPKVTIDVLIQLKGEQDRADASSNMPNNIPLPTDGNGSTRKRKASAIEECFDVDSRSKLDALIARMFYTAGLPFNLARNPWFRQAFMFAANGKLAGYVPPSYNKIRTSLLVQEKTHVERMLQPIKSTWSSKGVSIVSDGWSDPQRRPLLNFMAVTEDGPMFLRAVNTVGDTKSKEYIFEKLVETIDFIGAENVVQVVTDNASNCRGAGLMVEQKYPHIFWTPCVVHTLNLALKSIFAARNEEDPEYEHCNWISEVSSDTQQIRNFIMNHSMRLSMFNDVEVDGREAPHVDEELSIERNKCFRRMFADGPELHKIKQQFGNFSLFAAAFSSFDSIEDRTYLEPKIWWGIHGNSAPELQKLALKLLGQPSSSSCAERNWSTYGLIHSTARNRLNPGRAEDLVYVHQNLRLISRRSAEYSKGPTRFWDIGGDTHDIFGGGADFLQQAVLSLDEPELEALLDDLEAFENEAN